MTLDDIIKFINNEYKVDITDKSKKGKLPTYRYYYFYIASKYLPLKSYAKIGKSVNKDHSTVLAGLADLNDLKTLYKDVRFEITDLETNFKNEFKDDIDKDIEFAYDLNTLSTKRRLVRLHKKNKELNSQLSMMKKSRNQWRKRYQNVYINHNKLKKLI